MGLNCLSFPQPQPKESSQCFDIFLEQVYQICLYELNPFTEQTSCHTWFYHPLTSAIEFASFMVQIWVKALWSLYGSVQFVPYPEQRNKYQVKIVLTCLGTFKKPLNLRKVEILFFTESQLKVWSSLHSFRTKH